jgi:hypothetical protein
LGKVWRAFYADESPLAADQMAGTVGVISTVVVVSIEFPFTSISISINLSISISKQLSGIWHSELIQDEIIFLSGTHIS